MRPKFKRAAIFAGGLACIPIGIAGLALPFLQGILFLALGIVLLSISSPEIQQWLERHTRRFPRVHAAVERMEELVVRIIGRP